MEKNIRQFLNEFTDPKMNLFKEKLRILRTNLEKELDSTIWTKYDLETNNLLNNFNRKKTTHSVFLHQFYEMTDQSAIINFINWMLNEIPETEDDQEDA